VKSEIKKRQKTQQKQDGCRNSPDFAESSRSSSTCGQGAATSAMPKGLRHSVATCRNRLPEQA
jgi:hypothetical protein